MSCPLPVDAVDQPMAVRSDQPQAEPAGVHRDGCIYLRLIYHAEGGAPEYLISWDTGRVYSAKLVSKVGCGVWQQPVQPLLRGDVGVAHPSGGEGVGHLLRLGPPRTGLRFGRGLRGDDAVVLGGVNADRGSRRAQSDRG